DAYLEQMGGQRQDVVAALAQRVHRQRENVEPVIEVFAEAAAGHFGAQQPVGGGDDAHVERLGFAATDALDLALLQYAQQLGLQRQRHLRDFIEQQGATLRLFEFAGM